MGYYNILGILTAISLLIFTAYLQFSNDNESNKATIRFWGTLFYGTTLLVVFLFITYKNWTPNLFKSNSTLFDYNPSFTKSTITI